MINDPYRDEDLVELYDLDNPGGEDHAYYRALADQLDARSIAHWTGDWHGAPARDSSRILVFRAHLPAT